jgi:hypothetical protein
MHLKQRKASFLKALGWKIALAVPSHQRSLVSPRRSCSGIGVCAFDSINVTNPHDQTTRTWENYYVGKLPPIRCRFKNEEYGQRRFSPKALDRVLCVALMPHPAGSVKSPDQVSLGNDAFSSSTSGLGRTQSTDVNALPSFIGTVRNVVLRPRRNNYLRGDR